MSSRALGSARNPTSVRESGPREGVHRTPGCGRTGVLERGANWKSASRPAHLSALRRFVSFPWKTTSPLSSPAAECPPETTLPLTDGQHVALKVEKGARVTPLQRRKWNGRSSSVGEDFCFQIFGHISKLVYYATGFIS